MKTRRKRIARPKRSASRQRFRIKALRLPKLQVPKSQQRELAGIGFLLLAGLLVLAVALQGTGSAMHLLRGGLVGLFGWGVVFVILAALIAAGELLMPWIETMTWGRGLGIALILISTLGLLDVSFGHSGGSVGRAEGGALTSLAGPAGGILILGAVFLGALVLAFNISFRNTVGALREHYLANRPEPKPVQKEKRPAEAWQPRNQVVRNETSEPVLVPIQGVAAPPAASPRPVEAEAEAATASHRLPGQIRACEPTVVGKLVRKFAKKGERLGRRSQVAHMTREYRIKRFDLIAAERDRDSFFLGSSDLAAQL